MERELKEITTKGGVKAKIKTWLTRDERDNIKYALINEVEIDVNEEDSDTKEKVKEPQMKQRSSFKGHVIRSREHAIITNVVASLEGSADKVLERFLQLRAEDADEIEEATQKLVSSEVDKKK